jgi:hypothetical protein
VNLNGFGGEGFLHGTTFGDFEQVVSLVGSEVAIELELSENAVIFAFSFPRQLHADALEGPAFSPSIGLHRYRFASTQSC